jgi:hypothetical protein
MIDPQASTRAWILMAAAERWLDEEKRRRRRARFFLFRLLSQSILSSPVNCHHQYKVSY